MKLQIRPLIEEPYRIFFPLGMLIACVGIGHWPFYGLGWSETYSTLFHSSLQTQAYMICFIVGFLTTAMPRFSASAPASVDEVLVFLGLIATNIAFLSFGLWQPAALCFAGILISLLLFAIRRIGQRAKNSNVQPPLEFVWIPMGIFHGLVGVAAISMIHSGVVSKAWYSSMKMLLEQGFIFCIVIGVGGFLAPRLMGTFRMLNKPGQLPNDPALVSFRNKILRFHLLAGMLFFSSFFLNKYQPVLAYGLRAFVVTAEYLWTCSYLRWPKVPDLMAKLVWLSLLMVVLGSWAIVVFPMYRTAMLHIVFIGGYSLMIFAVASMVVLSHGGQPDQARKPLILFWLSGFAMLTSVGFRLLAAIYPEKYFLFLSASSFIWLIAAIYWVVFSIPKIFKSQSAEDIERAHEDAKKRVAQFRGGK